MTYYIEMMRQKGSPAVLKRRGEMGIFLNLTGLVEILFFFLGRILVNSNSEGLVPVMTSPRL